MKILHIATNSDLGGISKYIMEIVYHLPKDIESYFIMATPGYLSDELEKFGIPKDRIFFVPMTNSIVDLKTHIKSNMEVIKIVKEIQPDIIHANATTGSIVSAIAGFITKTPTLYADHGWPFTEGIKGWKRVFYKVLDYFLCRLFTVVTCETPFDYRTGVEVMPYLKKKNNLIIVHNGISDVEDKFKKKEFSKDELKIFMVARFCPQKDPYTLIKAVGELNNEGLNVKLDLWGYGQEEEQVLECIRQYNTENIKCRGIIADDIPLFPEYDIFSLISHWEGLPISIIEALRAGLPIVVSDICGNFETIRDNGYLIPRRDVKTLKEKIKYLYENKQLLSIMGENSRKLYEEEFTAEKMVNTLLGIYKQIKK